MHILIICPTLNCYWNCWITNCWTNIPNMGIILDIDECSLNVHNCTATEVCLNTVGGFLCPCISGYSKQSGGGCKGEILYFIKLNLKTFFSTKHRMHTHWDEFSIIWIQFFNKTEFIMFFSKKNIERASRRLLRISKKKVSHEFPISIAMFFIL